MLFLGVYPTSCHKYFKTLCCVLRLIIFCLVTGDNSPQSTDNHNVQGERRPGLSRSDHEQNKPQLPVKSKGLYSSTEGNRPLNSTKLSTSKPHSSLDTKHRKNTG